MAEKVCLAEKSLNHSTPIILVTQFSKIIFAERLILCH